MRRDLPSGTVTFLFTDVEGSTRLLDELGTDSYAAALAEHRRIVREAVRAHGGVEVDTQGDAFFIAFPTARDALRAAAETQAALAPGPIRVRIGIHTGTPHVGEEGYVGADVHRAARIAACGHGGQVLVSAATAVLAGGAGLRDLGEHRLKDLAAPERIYQLGEGEFAPLNSLHRTNLPVPSTPFLGRRRELGDVLELLANEGVRLLTLTGPGGTGKTRLALQVAAEASEDFPDGVFWVPLASLRDPELVLEAAGQALGGKEGLAEQIGAKALLLFFDNFEHVVEAANALPALLAACPNLRLLVTSRELLRVPGEQAYPVPPLEPADGLELFLARARAALPTFTAGPAVAEVCARLENLPLALELAAARVRVLSPEQLVQRLERQLDLLKGGRGADPRQQTLRAAIEWSYDLLEDDERRLFVRLAAFRGGCTLEAAEEVAEAELDTLQSLVDKSLLRHSDERFWMLETIRAYAAERLEASGEGDELRGRHAQHFLALAEDAEPGLIGGRPGDWPDRLEREHDNLRAALDRFEAAGETDALLRLAGALREFWDMRGHVLEGRRRLEHALGRAERPTAARAKALNGAAVMALESGDAEAAKRRAEEGLALHRRLGDVWGTADSLLALGLAVADRGEMAAAQQLFEEGAGLFGELGDEHNRLWATRFLAWTYNDLGDRERARALHEQNLRRARSLGNEQIAATTLSALGSYAVDEGRVHEAVPMLEEAYRIDRDRGNRIGMMQELCRFAGALVAAGKAREAARVLSSFQALYEESGASVRPYLLEENDRTLAAIRAELEEAELAEAWERGRTLAADEAVALALRALAP